MSIRNQVTGDLPNITTYTAEGSIVDINLPGNVNAGGNVSATGNVNGHGLTVQGEAIITGNANVQGTLTYNNVTNITTANLVLGLGNTQTGINVDGGGMVVGNTAEAAFTYDQPTSSWNSNIGISAVGNIEAPYFIGDGSQLTGLPAGYSDSDVGNYLASGADTGNIVTAGNISGTYFIGNGSQLTGIIPVSTSISNGTSNVVVAANGNITMSVANVANVVTVTSSGMHVAGNIYDSTGQLYGVAAGYMSAKRATQQTTGLTANNPVLFDTVNNMFGTDISLNTSTGQFTLQAGKTYRLMASPGYATFSAAGYVVYQWYNVTAGAYFGNKFSADSLTTTGNIAPSFGPTVTLFTPTITTTVQLNIMQQSQLVSLGAPSDGTLPYADIEVIGGQAPIIGVQACNFYAGFASQPANVTTGATIKFNGNYSSTGTGVAYNSTTGVFTLQPGTYSLTAGLGLTNTAGNSELDYIWYNITASVDVGTAGGLIVNSNSVPAAWQPTAQAVVTLTAPAQFKLYASFSGGTGQIQGSQSYAFINQIAGQVPVSGGTNVATSLAKYTRTTQQTTGLTANSAIICNTVESLIGSDIVANTTTGQITLQPGKTYRLTGMVPGFTVSSGTDTRLAVCWYNETTGGYIGNSAECYSAASGANFGTFGGEAEAIVSPSVTTVVTFKILGVNGNVSGLGGNSDFNTTGSYPWVDVEVIGGYAPITNAAQYGSNTAPITGAVAGTNSATASTVMTIDIPSAGTWQINAVVCGDLNLGQECTWALYDGSTVVAGTESKSGYIANVTYQGQGTSNWQVTTMTAKTYTVKAWGPGTNPGVQAIRSDGNGRTYATWTQIASLNAYRVLTANSTVTVTGTSSNPTFGNRNGDRIAIVDDGSGWCTLTMNLSANTAGTSGSGDYLFALPGGYAFDTTYQPISTQTGNPQGSWTDMGKMIAASGTTSAWIAPNNYTYPVAGVVPASATTFKIAIQNAMGASTASTVVYIGSAVQGAGVIDVMYTVSFMFKKA